MELNKVYFGDCIEEMKKLPDGCVQTCVTSPPYWGLRDYGTAKWEGGDKNCDHKIPVKYMDKLRRGSEACSYSAQLNREKCHKCGAIRIDSQLGLEETPEEYVESMVKVFREVKRILRKDGTLWLNIGDNYMTTPAGNKEPSGINGGKDGKRKESGCINSVKKPYGDVKMKDLVGIPWMVALALRKDGWYLRSDIIWHKPNPMPESVTDRPTKSHEYIFLLSKSCKYYYDADAIREPSVWADKDKRADGKRHQSKGECESGQYACNVVSYNPKGRNKRSVWTINTSSYKGSHFATYPPELIKPCILAGSKVGDVVFDPFMGSGTTAQVSGELDRNWIGTELNEKNFTLVKSRTKKFFAKKKFEKFFIGN